MGEFPWALNNIYTSIFSRQYNADPDIPRDEHDPPLPEAIKRAHTTKHPLDRWSWHKPGFLNYPKNFEVMDKNLEHTRESWKEERKAEEAKKTTRRSSKGSRRQPWKREFKTQK